MPRFGFEADYDGPTTGNYEEVGAKVGATRSSRIRLLSCLSPDGRSVHSLSSDGCVETHSLPLEGTSDDEILDRDMPSIVRTQLPERVLKALKLNQAIELVCVEGDSMPTSLSPLKQLLPLLCLYTSKAAFLIQISYPPTTVGIARGEVMSLSEPFESILLTSSSIDIIRLRPAPQRYMGYALMCPRGSMAALVRDASINEFRLVLHHGNGRVTTPLEFSLEDFDGSNNVCDFCFGQSNELSLLATMSIYLLQQSGNILAASPIPFHGAVASVMVVMETTRYLEDLIASEKRDAQFRRARAAQCMLVQIFGEINGKDSFDTVTAQVGVGGVNHATKWPVQIQGPVIVPPVAEPDDASKALAIEVFFSMDLVGLVVAREGSRCHFCVTLPSAVLPRTTYESIDNSWDSEILNKDLQDLGAVVEQVEVDDEQGHQPSVTTAWVRDPSDSTMIHFVSDFRVVTFITNAMEIFSQNVRDVVGEPGFVSPSKVRKAHLKSTAFVLVSVAGDARLSLQGAVVTGDAQLGHSMIARLSDSSMHAVNVTETKYRHESEALVEWEDEQSQQPGPSDDALRAVEATQPLIDIVKPVLEKIQSGLDEVLTKIVGAATNPKDIDPAALAVVLNVKKNCEMKVIIPLKELRRLSQSRLSELKQMMKIQISQLQAIKETNKLLKARIEKTSEKLKTAEGNAKKLANRSTTLHHTSQMLQHTICNAEQEYFDLLESLNSKLTVWEDSYAVLQERSEIICEAADSNLLHCTVELDADEAKNCKKLLHGNEVVLKRCSERVQTTRVLVQRMAATLGIPMDGQYEYHPDSQ